MDLIQNDLTIRPERDNRLRIVEEASRPSPRGQLRACLFIHGYNVSENEAADDFNDLARLLERSGVPAWFLKRTAWLLLWRAYAAVTPTKRSRVSFGSYRAQVNHSIVTADALARYIRSLSAPGGLSLDLVLIAHSLGSRLVLETLRLLAEDPAPHARITTVFMMAAAVPVALVDKGRRLRKAAEGPHRTYVLYSQQDDVLCWVFRLAQGIEREEGWIGWLPRAVGATGLPASTWNSTCQTRNGHGGYFQDLGTAAKLAEALGWTPPRRPDVRHVPNSPPPQSARPARRSLASRALNTLRRSIL